MSFHTGAAEHTEQCFDLVAEALECLAEKGAKEDLTVAVEKEAACNIATAAEGTRVLKAVVHPNLKLVWDAANASVSWGMSFPDGYRKLPVDRIVHVDAKDCYLDGHKPIWGPVGACNVDWKGQFAALLKDGLSGAVSLKTHWPGPAGTNSKPAPSAAGISASCSPALREFAGGFQLPCLVVWRRLLGQCHLVLHGRTPTRFVGGAWGGRPSWPAPWPAFLRLAGSSPRPSAGSSSGRKVVRRERRSLGRHLRGEIAEATRTSRPSERGINRHAVEDERVSTGKE